MGIKRFGKYATTGFLTFLLDLLLLFILIDLVSVYYILASVLSFMIATSLNYFLVRSYVFSQTERGIKSGYAIFLSMSGIGLFIVSIGMFVSVELLSVHYLIARGFVVAVVFLVNYFLNLHLNFKVVGKH